MSDQGVGAFVRLARYDGDGAARQVAQALGASAASAFAGAILMAAGWQRTRTRGLFLGWARKAGDDNDAVFAPAGQLDAFDATALNTDSGTVYAMTSANGLSWDVAFYSRPSCEGVYLVAMARAVAAGQSFAAVQRNGSGLTICWALGHSVAPGRVTVALDPFRESGPSATT